VSRKGNALSSLGTVKLLAQKLNAAEIRLHTTVRYLLQAGHLAPCQPITEAKLVTKKMKIKNKSPIVNCRAEYTAQ